MSKSSAKAFARGLSYHTGAGIGEAIRAVTTTGAIAAIGLAVSYANTRIEEKRMANEAERIIRPVK